MAENSSITTPSIDFEMPPDLSFDEEGLSSDFMTQKVPDEHGPEYDDFSDCLSNIVKKFVEMTTGSKPSRSDVPRFEEKEQAPNSDDKDPSHYDVLEEIERVRIESEKLELKMWALSLSDSIVSDDSEMDKNSVEFAREKVREYMKSLKPAENFAERTEPKKDYFYPKKNQNRGNFYSETNQRRDYFYSRKLQQKEKLAEWKYERKNTIFDREPHLRWLYKEFFLNESSKVNFAEGGLKCFCKNLTDYIELDLSNAVRMLRYTTCQKLCKRHFSPAYSSGASVEADKDISISIDRFEFSHKELKVNFLELVQSENFSTIASDYENDPKINNIIPSFIEFLESGHGFQFPTECCTIILAILKNPCRKLEFIFDEEFPVVKEQLAMAQYLVNCLQISNSRVKKKVMDKCAEAITRFAKIHPSFLALFVAGFNDLLSSQNGKRAYHIYCNVLNIMESIGPIIIGLCLPQHFEKIFELADKHSNRKLYFQLLKTCETLIIKNNSNLCEMEPSSDESNLISFYNTCCQYFGDPLTDRLKTVFKKSEESKHRLEHHLLEDHAKLQIPQSSSEGASGNTSGDASVYSSEINQE